MKDYNAIFGDAQRKARETKYVYQYTTLDAVEMIIKNRSLKLNRIDQVNDLMEQARLEPIDRKKGFVSCITYRERESYFFWKAYSHRDQGKIGVRVAFPVDILELQSFYFDAECIRTIPKVEKTDEKHNEYRNEDDWGLWRHYSANIIYTEDLQKFNYVDEGLKETFGDCVNLEDKNFERTALSCFVKTIEWDTEEETRIAAFVRPKGFEDIPGRTAFKKHKHTYPQPGFDEIFLHVRLTVLSNIGT